jgi:hypothetical protein
LRVCGRISSGSGQVQLAETGRERGTERKTEREEQREREKERDRERQRERQRERLREAQRERQTEGQIEGQRAGSMPVGAKVAWSTKTTNTLDGDTEAKAKACAGMGSGRVGIVGGGIGGLALAIALLNKGIDCMVFERDRSFAERSQGYGLTMQQGAKTLKKLGVKLSGISSSIHLSLLPNGELLGAYGREWREDQERTPATVRRRKRAGSVLGPPGSPKRQGPKSWLGPHQMHSVCWLRTGNHTMSLLSLYRSLYRSLLKRSLYMFLFLGNHKEAAHA